MCGRGNQSVFAEIYVWPWRSMHGRGDRCAAGEMIRICGDQCVAMEIDTLPPKDKQIRNTSTAQQQDCSDKKHKKNLNKGDHHVRGGEGEARWEVC